MLIIPFILNAIWELLHYRLYFDTSGIPRYPHLLIASIADMFIVFSILMIVSAKNKGLQWLKRPGKIDYAITIILGLFIAAINEYINLGLGRWSYKESMPTIIGIGLSPLIQLSTTAVISILLIKNIISSE